jgi:hypothetical protein
MPSASDIKERVFEQDRADYLALNDPEDQQAIQTFNQFFDAEAFRHDYYIHLVSGSTNAFWWYRLEEYPEGGPYTLYMKPLSLVGLTGESIFRMRADKPLTRATVSEALQSGYAVLQEARPVIELRDVPAVVASREGENDINTTFMTVVVELRGDLFAIATIVNHGHRAEVVDHLADLLKTTKSANH